RRNLPAQPEVEQLTFLRTGFEPTLHLGISLALATRDNVARRASATWVLNGRGLAHRALAERALLARDGRDPTLAPLVRKLAAGREERARLAFLARGAEPTTDFADKLAALAKQEQDLVKEIGERRGRITTRDDVTLDQVRAALSADSVLIEMVRFTPTEMKAGPGAAAEQHYAVWIVGTGQARVDVVDLGPARAIDTAVKAVR